MVGCQLCGSVYNLKRCSHCKDALYCSRDHQMRHWTSHQKNCAPSNPQLSVNPRRIAIHKSSHNTPYKRPDTGININRGGDITSGSVNHTLSLPPEIYLQFMSAQDENPSAVRANNLASSMNSWSSVQNSYTSCPSTLPAKFSSSLVEDKSHKVVVTSPTCTYDDRGEEYKPVTEVEPAQDPNVFELLSYPLRNMSLARNIPQISKEDLARISCQYLINDLDKYGICVIDDFLGATIGKDILREFKGLYSKGVFQDGKVLKNTFTHPSGMIRGDQTMWVNGTEICTTNIKSLIELVDAIVMTSCRHPNNGKLGEYRIQNRTKAMLAVYPGRDSQYVKHVDNPNKDGRCITSIYYLNENWNSKDDGGLLRIFPTEWDRQVADIEPLFDRMLFFWSDRRNPHEVLPSKKTRFAITLWYYDQNERMAYESRRAQAESDNLNGSTKI